VVVSGGMNLGAGHLRLTPQVRYVHLERAVPQ
jgi:hypothetical protein